MATSRRVPLMLVSIAALGAAVAACDSILGLGNYHDVACDPYTGEGNCDAGSGSFDSSPPPDSTLFDVFEAGGDDATDSGVGADAAPEAMPLSDAPYDAPSVTALWARWPMPNPDAAIYPGASMLLPNPMAYDAGADGGDGTVLDLVTNLRWSLSPVTPSGTFNPATAGCPPGFQVPTRIQLVTLIDFTRGNPTIDTSVFTQVMGDRYWTSSSVPPGGMAPYWTVDFSNGLVSNASTGVRVLCVKEGP